MGKVLLYLLLYGIYCLGTYFYLQEAGNTDRTRWFATAAATVPLWGIPLVLKIYRTLSRKRQR